MEGRLFSSYLAVPPGSELPGEGAVGGVGQEGEGGGLRARAQPSTITLEYCFLNLMFCREQVKSSSICSEKQLLFVQTPNHSDVQLLSSCLRRATVHIRHALRVTEDNANLELANFLPLVGSSSRER